MVHESQAVEGDDSEDGELDSLFDSDSPTLSSFPALPISGGEGGMPVAQRTAPPIPGLFFEPSVLIPLSLAQNLELHVQKYFDKKGSGDTGSVNQVMFFGRTSDAGSGLPPFLDDLLIALSRLLKPHIPTDVYKMIFTPFSLASRQAILNHYIPGEGITPHVDLLTRFGDGILAVSMGSGIVMTFRFVGDSEKNERGSGAGSKEQYDFYLPERSVLVLTGDARYKWSHGIEGRLGDMVDGEEGRTWIERKTRVSITLRWLLPGADVVGGLE